MEKVIELLDVLETGVSTLDESEIRQAIAILREHYYFKPGTGDAERAAARRERIAVAMMAALVALPNTCTVAQMVEEALQLTDALIAELDGEGEKL